MRGKAPNLRSNANVNADAINYITRREDEKLNQAVKKRERKDF